MKPEIKEKWTSALLSGEYRQGQDCLHHEDSFCCLGVLCDLYLKEHPQEQWRSVDDSVTVPLLIDGEEGYLPTAVQEWAGLEEENPIIKVGKETVATLSGLNDQGVSFKTIARLIEEQL